MDNFNDLFNEFMNNDSNKGKNKVDDKMSELLKKLSNLSEFDDNSIAKHLKDINGINNSLGEPDKVEYYEENGVYYQKQIWNTTHGQVIKTVISDVPFKNKKTETKKTRVPLETQLEVAVKEENYELAAKLRDRITKRNEKKNKK
jgi:excinuclease UvrABC helicase subunit UvrB